MTVTRPHPATGHFARVEHRLDWRRGLWIRTERGFDWENREWKSHRFEYTTSDICEIYNASRTLGDFCTFFYIRPHQAKPVLDFARAGFIEQLAAEYRSSMSLFELSERHGASETLLGKWLRQHGVRVRPGRRRPELKPREVHAASEKYHSTNGVARHFGIAWQTAQKILDETEVRQPPSPKADDTDRDD